MKVLGSLLPQDGYDNSPHLDMILVSDPDLLGNDDALPVYRARLNGAPVTAILTVIAPGGYVGSIKLLVGIRPDGTITGVRTLEHLETPGLGDKIDYEKTPWIGSFTGRSIDKPPLAAWETRRSGGEFEQITGATVTSRAVVSGVRNALLYFEENAEFIFTAPARPDPQ
jgi:electron transport complex protein RnfG